MHGDRNPELAQQIDDVARVVVDARVVVRLVRWSSRRSRAGQARVRRQPAGSALAALPTSRRPAERRGSGRRHGAVACVGSPSRNSRSCGQSTWKVLTVHARRSEMQCATRCRAVPAAERSVSAQRHRRIDAHRAARGREAGDHCDDEQQHRRRRRRAAACRGRHAEQQARQQTRRRPGERRARATMPSPTCASPSPRIIASTCCGARADGHAHADLLRALADGVAEHAEHADGGEQQALTRQTPTAATRAIVASRPTRRRPAPSSAPGRTASRIESANRGAEWRRRRPRCRLDPRKQRDLAHRAESADTARRTSASARRRRRDGDRRRRRRSTSNGACVDTPTVTCRPTGSSRAKRLPREPLVDHDDARAGLCVSCAETCGPRAARMPSASKKPSVT